MTYLLILPGILIFAILIAFFMILSHMDRKRMHSFLYAKAMKEHLDVFVHFITQQVNEQCSDPESKNQFLELTEGYSKTKKNRSALERIPLFNSLVTLYNSLKINAPLSGAADARDDLYDAYEEIEMLRSEYDKSVTSLNKKLDNRLFAGVSKILRIKKLDKLCDVSSLLTGLLAQEDYHIQ